MTRKKGKEYYIRKLADLELKDFNGSPIKAPSDAYPVIKHYGKADVEYFLLLTLNGNHRVIRIHEISKGTLGRTVIHPREVFRAALLDNAAAVILAHNHPSGNISPSSEDLLITTRLRDAGDIMGISVLDHLIIGDGYYSFSESGDI